MTTVATNPKTASAVPPPVNPQRKAPVIDPANVSEEIRGLNHTRWVVRLPLGFVSDDLKELEVWNRVQNSGSKTLRQWDELFVIAHDQSWAAEAVVSHATRTTATLAGIRIISTPQRHAALFADETYKVVWSGVGYHVERIADGHKMTQTVGSPQLAERDLRNLYPQKVGAH